MTNCAKLALLMPLFYRVNVSFQKSQIVKIEVFHFSEDDRKLFVGGLPQEAKDLDIKEYFGQYGEIDNINLKTDPHTGRSRGFAFIVFKVNLCFNHVVWTSFQFPFLYKLF